jgi:hypothetical protein
MASKNEKRAAELGLTLKEYKATSEYKNSKKSSDSQKKEEKQIKEYYNQKESDIEEQASTDSARLSEDLANVMADTGIEQTRATEDYIRNIGNIEANKAADVDDVNNYVATQSTRTSEDLDTSLAKESRRYSIEYDKTNQSLADSGLTFSDRKQEKIDAAGNAQNIADAQTIASRSFQDIARYEAVKNRDIELNYGQQTAEEEVKKARTLEDILNEQADAKLKEQRGQEDITTSKAIDIRNNDYAETGALSDTSNFYDTASNTQKNQQDLLTTNG